MRLSLIVGLAAFVCAADASPKDEMMAADKAFSALSVEKGRHAAFLAYMTDDARLFQGEHPPIIGKAAAAVFFAEEEKKDPSYAAQQLSWTPLEAEASPDGKLGFTRGSWVWNVTNPDGSRKTAAGYYVTAWRYQPDGSYKFCLDLGGTDKH